MLFFSPYYSVRKQTLISVVKSKANHDRLLSWFCWIKSTASCLCVSDPEISFEVSVLFYLALLGFCGRCCSSKYCISEWAELSVLQVYFLALHFFVILIVSLITVDYCLGKWCPSLVLKGHYPACFSCFSAFVHMIWMNEWLPGLCRTWRHAEEQENN